MSHQINIHLKSECAKLDEEREERVRREPFAFSGNQFPY
jgi:glutamine synthetase type III